MCLDDAEDVIMDDREGFADFISECKDACENLRIIITSNKNVGSLRDNQVPNSIFLGSLRPKYAAQLFWKNLGSASFTEQQYVDFLAQDKNYPYNKLLPSFKGKDNPKELSAEDKK